MHKETVRAGLIGSGFAASFHYEALRRVYGVQVEVAGVYSPKGENCRRFAADRELTAFDDPAALMDACDVVHLCTPPSTHEALAAEALSRDKHVIVEKPFTGYFGDGSPAFSGDRFDRALGLEEAVASVRRLLEAEARSAGRIFYGENWVYAPAVQKEREILEKTDAQILWMHGEESHSGSHSALYGDWAFSGGGSIMGKSVHPLTAALYLKRVEGRRDGKVLRPLTVSARTHSLTRMEGYRDRGYLRRGYKDIEDFGALHVTFSDGTIADIFASEIIMGGVHNYLEVSANNHRTMININPNTAMQTYNPQGEQFRDIYVVEKIGTKEGWACTSPDEDWFTGYQNEMESFYSNAARNEVPESDGALAADTISVVYAAYLSAERKGREVEVPLV